MNDDFGSGTYTLTDGQVSPNGKWKCIYNGFGTVGCAAISNPKNNTSLGTGTYCMVLQPQVNQGGTSAALVLSEESFNDFDATFYMRTFSQNRTPTPNSWETAWFMFRFTDDTHHYYCMLKSNGGFEIGKKDYIKIGTNKVQTPNGVLHTVTNQDQQQFIFTSENNNFALQTWYKFRVVATGNNIKVYINDVLKADVTDNGTIGTDGITNTNPIGWGASCQLMYGRLGFYVEDCKGEFDNIVVQ
jgi:hypothetical protein